MSDALLTNELQEDKKLSVDHTGGEKVFDIGTYYGIGWVVNALSSVYLTDKAIRSQAGWEWLYNGRVNLIKTFTEFGEKFIEKPELWDVFKNHPEFAGKALTNQACYDLWEKSGGSFENLAAKLGGSFTTENVKQIRDYIVHNEAMHSSMSALAGIALLCSGGFLLMEPIKQLEDHKLDIVKFLDEKVVDPLAGLTGHAPPSEEEKQQRQARYEELAAAPKQTRASILVSRLAAVLPIWAAHVACSQPNNIIKAGAAKVAGVEYVNPNPNVGFGGGDHYFDAAGNAVGGFIAPNAKDPAAFNKNTGLLINDFSYSLVAATATYWFTRLFAPMFDKGAKTKDAETTLIETAQPKTHANAAGTSLQEIPKPATAKNNIVPLNKLVGDASHQGAVSPETKPELTFA
jgi:hypothetical protein